MTLDVIHTYVIQQTHYISTKLTVKKNFIADLKNICSSSEYLYYTFTTLKTYSGDEEIRSSISLHQQNNTD